MNMEQDIEALNKKIKNQDETIAVLLHRTRENNKLILKLLEKINKPK